MIRGKNYYTFNEYMRGNDLTPSEEDYLEMIYRLQLSDSQVKVAQLAKALNVKTPSASAMVKRLQGKGYLIHESYSFLKLSESGQKIGELLLERHNTIEIFLKIIGVKNRLHEETEKIEHTISEETLFNIMRLVDFFNSNEEVFKSYRDFK